MRYTLFSTPILSPTLRIISRGILKVIRWRVSGSLPEDQKKYLRILDDLLNLKLSNGAR